MFFVVMIAVCLLKYFMLQKELRRKCEPSDEGIFVGEHKFIFDEEGIQSQGKGYKSSLAWSVVRKIERGRGMILVYQDTENAYVFPESKLDNPNEFYNFITEQYSKTMGERTLDQF